MKNTEEISFCSTYKNNKRNLVQLGNSPIDRLWATSEMPPYLCLLKSATAPQTYLIDVSDDSDQINGPRVRKNWNNFGLTPKSLIREGEPGRPNERALLRPGRRSGAIPRLPRAGVGNPRPAKCS